MVDDGRGASVQIPTIMIGDQDGKYILEAINVAHVVV